MKTGYEYLRELTSFSADFTAFTPNIDPITNRVQYIVAQLENLGVDYEVDVFNSTNAEDIDIATLLPITKRVNIEVKFPANNDTVDSIIYLAHHDVANVKSENCNDNTASVCNLIHLCSALKGKELDKNIFIIFTDAEETVSFTSSGATRLAKNNLKGKYGNLLIAYNLELTAFGTEVWSDRNLEELQQGSKDFTLVRTPYNDSVVLRLTQYSIKSTCLGILTKSELNNVKSKGYCDTWSLCHSEGDKFENAVEEDMINFVEYLISLI